VALARGGVRLEAKFALKDALASPVRFERRRSVAGSQVQLDHAPVRGLGQRLEAHTALSRLKRQVDAPRCGIQGAQALEYGVQ
jgi:hypothetical protein